MREHKMKKLKATHTFTHAVVGIVEAGQTFFCEESVAKSLLKEKVVELFKDDTDKKTTDK